RKLVLPALWHTRDPVGLQDRAERGNSAAPSARDIRRNALPVPQDTAGSTRQPSALQASAPARRQLRRWTRAARVRISTSPPSLQRTSTAKRQQIPPTQPALQATAELQGSTRRVAARRSAARPLEATGTFHPQGKPRTAIPQARGSKGSRFASRQARTSRPF